MVEVGDLSPFRGPMSARELWDLRDRSGAFGNIPAIWRADANMMGAEKPERIELLGTSTNYFGMLGVHAQIGRLYNAFVHPGSTVLPGHDGDSE